MMHTALLLKRILRGDDAKIVISTSRECVLPNEVLDNDIDNFDSNECLMHGDNGVTQLLSSIF